MGEILTKAYTAPAIDRREALRYAGVRGEDAEYGELLDSCLEECQDAFTYKACYAEFPILEGDGGSVDLGFAKVSSGMLAERLDGCDRVIIFAATVGLEIDRLIAKNGRIAPSRALLLQAIGAERIEALCDCICRDIEAELPLGEEAIARVSPGYSDLPLEFQTDIFRALDCGRKIGLYLNGSLLMSPTKSVTAIVGIRSKKD